MAHGNFCWNELLTGDVEAAKNFYSATIGWTFDSMPMPHGGEYWVAMQDSRPAAGIVSKAALNLDHVPPHWFSYLEVDDVDARVTTVVANGGTVMKPPFDIQGVGRVAIILDSSGAPIGLMTPKT